MEEVYEFLKKCGTFYLATVDGDKPRVRPFGVVHIFEGKLYIQTGKIKNVSKQMQINPNIEILGEYVNNETKIGCLCKQCGLEWFTTPHILKGRHGCPHCSKFKNSK